MSKYTEAIKIIYKVDDYISNWFGGYPYTDEEQEMLDSLKLAIDALEKQIPKEPIEDYYMDIDPITGEPYPVGIVSLCPNCKTWLDIEDGCGEKSKHCKECGQAICVEVAIKTCI